MRANFMFGRPYTLAVRQNPAPIPNFLACAEAEEALARGLQYTAERRRRGLYRDEGLHLAVLRLVLSLLLTPGGSLDPAYTDKLPLLRRMQNVPHVLYHHLSHRECALPQS